MSTVARIPLKEGLRLYWRHLVPITLLPIAFLSGSVFVEVKIAYWMTVPFFFAFSYYAGIPYLKKNVTYQFWLLACGLWMGGFMVGVVLSAILKSIFHA